MTELIEFVMAVLVTAIRFPHTQNMRQGHMYFMTNRPHGVLYVGVTSDLSRRVYEHRAGLLSGFTKKYGLKQLIYYETFPMVVDAIQREKNIKHWPRQWKDNLIATINPEWRSL